MAEVTALVHLATELLVTDLEANVSAFRVACTLLYVAANLFALMLAA